MNTRIGIGCLVLLLIFIGVMSDRGAKTGSPQPSEKPNPGIQRPAVPQHVLPAHNPAPDRITFSKSEVEAFKRFDASRAGPVPLNYATWVLAGKPEAHSPLP